MSVKLALPPVLANYSSTRIPKQPRTQRPVVQSWVSPNPRLKIDPLYSVLYFHTPLSLKTSETKTTVNPDKASVENFQVFSQASIRNCSRTLTFQQLGYLLLGNKIFRSIRAHTPGTKLLPTRNSFF